MNTEADRWTTLFTYLSDLQQVVRAGLCHADTTILLQRAADLSREFQAPFGNRCYRSALAATLIAIYDILNVRLAAAAVDSHGLPVVPGIRWNPLSPLAGTLEDIPPFAAIDTWVAALMPQLARRRPRGRTVRIPEMIIRGNVARPPQGSPSPQIPRPQLPRDVLATPEGPISGEISEWLDIIGALGDWAGFAAELLGLAAAEFAIGVFGVFLAIVGVPLNMWALQEEAMKIAAYNGGLRGFSEALEFLWRPYRGRNPAEVANWPALGQFTGQISSDGSSASDAAATGYRAGVKKANQFLQRLERERRHKGQLFLFAAAREYGSAHGVRVFILRHQRYRNAEQGYRLDMD